MTLLKLSDKQIESLNNKAENLCKGDLIFKLLSSLYFEEKLELITKEFNTRTASQILESGYATGCTDFAIVLCAFLKHLNVSYKYVEVIEKRWLDVPMNEKKVKGHAYVRIEDILVDPQRKIIYIDPSFVLTRYKIFGEAQEPHELGLTDFQTNVQKYFDFKRKYKNS
jgi:hypothetical protein